MSGTNWLTPWKSASEANSKSSSQEIIHLSQKLKIHSRVKKTPPLVQILSQMNSVHNFLPPYSLRFILILSSHLRLGFPSGLFPSGFPTKILYTFFISPMRATCSYHVIFLDSIALITFCEAYKLWSSSPWLNLISLHYHNYLSSITLWHWNNYPSFNYEQ